LEIAWLRVCRDFRDIHWLFAVNSQMSRRTQKNVGIVGLGIIGQRVAATLRRRGFHVFVWNRTPRPFPNFVGSPAEIATLCDFVQIFVSDDEALLEMVQQMKPALSASHVIMAHCTVAPHTMRAAAEIVHRRGARFMDAPFTGSKIAAEKGELVYYIGGDDAAYRRAKPVLEASSKEIIEIGEIGQATTIKLATNMVTAATVQVAAEALALVHNAGMPLEKFAAAMAGNGSNSGTMSMKLPKMIEGDFEPHFSVKHMLKDVLIATRLARSYGLSFGVTETARDSLLQEARRNREDYDYSSMIHSFFPDGPPGTETAEAAQVEEQGSLVGLDEAPAAAVSEEPVVHEEPASVPADEPRAESKPVIEHLDRASVDPEAESKSEAGERESVAPADAAEPLTLAKEEKAAELRAEETPKDDAEIGAPAQAEPVQVPVAAAPVGAKPAQQEDEPERRGFFDRLFRKGADY
jgi:3-hydroxyisobutyrate dehydrogenase-like beta-hydroxyacid dehydrogenase